MATISLLVQPYNYSPLSAPTWIVPYSTDYNVKNYSYLFNVFTYDRITNATSSFLGQYKVPPRITGEGVFDVHKILKSHFNGFSLDMSYVLSATSSLIPITDERAVCKYKFLTGYEEGVGATFTSTSNVGGFVQLNGVGYLDGVYAGDIITIRMNPLSSNQSYNGQALVLPPDLAGSLSTNIPFGVTESRAGYIIDKQYINPTASSFLYGLNGTRQYYDPNTNTSTNTAGVTDFYQNNNYIADVSPFADKVYSPLTSYNAPDSGIYKEIYTNQWEVVNILSVTHSSYRMRVFTYDVNKNILQGWSSATYSLSSDYQLYTMPVGTANLEGLSGLTSSLTLSNAAYYDVSFFIGNLNQTIVRRKIVTNCSPFQNVRIMFLNRVGGYDFYNFNYDSKLSTTIKRTEFNKTLNYNYKIGDRGRSVFTIDAESQTIINTDWISEYDYSFLQELATSPDVYVIDEVRNIKLPIIITDSNYDQKTLLREKLFNLTLTYKYAYNINTQSL